MNMALAKKEVTELDDYSVPQEGGTIKLNQNESPYEIPFSLKKRISDLWLGMDWARYPKLKNFDLLESVSRYAGHSSDGILLGVGSNELIQSVFLTFLERGDRLLVPDPGFAIYSRLGKILQAEIRFSKMNRHFQYDVGRIIKDIKKVNPRLAVFPSPHNPCGDILETHEVEQMLMACRGVLVIDEAYYEYSKNSAVELIPKFDNLLILRTFSKAFGLAGLRLGYLLGRPEVISQVGKAQMPFSVNSFNQLALAHILRHRGHVLKSVNPVVEERERMRCSLARIKSIRVFPTWANFLLFEIEEYPASEVFERLRKRNILVRSFHSPRLNSCLRVTIGRENDNRIFIKTLKEIMNELAKKRAQKS